MKKGTLTFLAVWLAATALFSQAGRLDSTFNGTGIVEMKVDNVRTGFYSVKAQPDGKAVAFGVVSDSTHAQAVVARFNTDGTLDNSFGENGLYTTANNSPYHVGTDGLLLPDGKLILVSDIYYKNEIALTCLLPNGTRDPAFGVDGVSAVFVDISLYSPYPYSLFLQPDGKFVIVGYYLDLDNNLIHRGFAMRVLVDGTLDTTFGTDGFVKFIPPNVGWKIDLHGGAAQPDGKIVLTGYMGSTSANQVWYIARLMPDGSLDTSFDGDGLLTPNLGNNFTEKAFDALLLPDGKLVVAGYGQKLPGQQMTVMRFLPTGALDNTFGLGGKTQIDFGCCHSYGLDIIQQPDGKLLVCGESEGPSLPYRFSIARLKPNGAVDKEFGTDGRVVVSIDEDSNLGSARGMDIQLDGKILVAGSTLNKADLYTESALLVRLNPGGSVATKDAHLFADAHLEVGPNPVRGNALRVSYRLSSSTDVTISMMDLLGQKATSLLGKTRRMEGAQTELVTLPEHLPAGEYFLRIDTEQGFQVVKILKTE